jgi:hypothetical protein
MHPDFAIIDMLHFFLSLTICGGIAWILPFFFGTALGLLTYYPALLRSTMQDLNFSARRTRLQKLAGRYVLGATLIPLLAATLHVMRNEASTGIILGAILVTALGISIGFSVYQNIEKRFTQITAVIERE